ncbi:hypothetical protein EMIHUDRAFT_250462, partial [Emiliania huxleyi CCMP1516]
SSGGAPGSSRPRSSVLQVGARKLLRKVKTPVELAKRQKGVARYVDPSMLRVTAIRSCAIDKANGPWPIPIISASEDRMAAVEQYGLGEDGPPHELFARRLARVYPAGTRMVSLNYQTNDTPVQISRALFALDNGFGCLHAIGGFCCVSRTLPLPARPAQRATVSASAAGKSARHSTLHCLAAEPRATVLRACVHDGETVVAYEAVVLGALRPGYRSLSLRSRLGTQIRLCSLLGFIGGANLHAVKRAE